MNKTFALGTLVAALAAGCGDGSSNSRLSGHAQKPEAVFAGFMNSTEKGQHVIAQDQREKTKGDILGITLGEEARVLAKASQNPMVQEVVGENAVISVSDGQQRDLVVAKVSTGQVPFRTSTTDRDEWFGVPAGNGMVFGEYNRTTGQFGLRIADFATGISRTLPIRHPRAHLSFTDPKTAVILGYGNGKQTAYTLDTKTGVLSVFLDLDSISDASHFVGPIKPDIVAYQKINQDIVFRFGQALVSTYTPSRTSNVGHQVKEVSRRNLQAIIAEDDFNTQQRTWKHVDLRVAQAREQNIDLSQSGISPDDVSQTIIGGSKVLIQAYDRNNGVEMIRFYDSNNGSVSDLLAGFGNVVEAWAEGHETGTALITAIIRTPNGTQTKLLHFNGNDVKDPFGTSYDSTKPVVARANGKYLVAGVRQLPNGQATDVLHLDGDSGWVTPLHSQVRGWVGSYALSSDGAAFATTDWQTNDHRLFYADMRNNGFVHQLGQSNSEFQVYRFSEDGNTIFARGSSGPKKVKRMDVSTNQTFNDGIFVHNTDN